jgi:antitoxin MazE
MKIYKCDAGLAVQLPQAPVDELGLKEGDEIEIVAVRTGVIEVGTKEQERRRAIENLTLFNFPLPPDYKFDRAEANER